MHIRWRGLELPGSVVPDQKTLTGTYGKFVAEPFERGFGTTVGNSLRRVLLHGRLHPVSPAEEREVSARRTTRGLLAGAPSRLHSTLLPSTSMSGAPSWSSTLWMRARLAAHSAWAHRPQ